MSATIPHKVSFGKAETQQDTIGQIKSAVATALMESGLPGAFSLDLSKTGVNGLTGMLHLRPTISKKDGRVMYNCTSQDVTIGGVAIKPMGNWMLPKNGFCVDSETHKAYSQAVAERDEKRKAQTGVAARTPQTDEELDAGETTE